MGLWEMDVRVPRGTFVNKLCKPNTRSPKRLATRHREPTKCLVNIITCGGAMPTAPMGSAEEALPQGFPQVNIITLLELLFGLHNKKKRLTPLQNKLSQCHSLVRQFFCL